MSNTTKRVRTLDDPAASSIDASGAKGAGIARAKAAGFPVLDGFVIAPLCSEQAFARAVEVLEPRGTGGARMAIIGHQLDEELLTEISGHAAQLEPPLIVRSSSVLEGSGEWSGAFTSIPEILRDEIGQATKSVWATAFSIEVLERFEEAGLEPGSAPMGVLVQSEIKPDFGGAAIVDAAGTVKIDAVKGSPADLMAGWVAGTRAVLEDGELRGADALELIGEDTVQAIADLALRVKAELGHNLIEWAVVDDQVILLQVQDSAVHEVEEAMVIPAALSHPFALDFVKHARQYPGALGDQLVLGWRTAAPHITATPFTSDAPREDVIAQATSMAATLLAQAWGESEEDAVAHADLVLRRMRSDRPNESIEVLKDLNSINEELASKLLGIADHLIATEVRQGRRGLDRWEPVLAGVVALQGEVHEGDPSVGGVGAGRLVWIANSKETSHVRPRDIIVTQYPLQNYSPLLWDAAGVITIGGAPTAHLFEVARSLTVPAVINCPIAEIVKEGPVLGMLDGDAGRVAILPRDPERPL